jgi:Beta-lactamase/Bacterial tandem repeat domain 1
MAYAWQARHGLTPSEYQTTFDLLTSQGYRLIDVSGYGVAGNERYAAVWEQSPGPAWQARHGLSAADHQALFATLPDQGYRPLRVSGYEASGADRYASQWEQSGGWAWRARHGLTAAELQAGFETLTPQGFRPIDVSAHTIADQPRFAAIWDKSPIPGWVARHGLSAADYQAEFDNWTSQGYVLWRVSGYEIGAKDFYAAIWVRGPALTWMARHGLAEAQYQGEFDALLAHGFRLISINGYSLRAETRYAAIWHKPYLSDQDHAFIRQRVTALMTNRGVPGASVALAHQGRLVFAQGYGVADQATNEPVTTAHLFRIASLAKPITSVAVFRLIEAGQLQLTDRVFGAGGILGTTFGTQPYGPNIDQITVQHLLEHTSSPLRPISSASSCMSTGSRPSRTSCPPARSRPCGQPRPHPPPAAALPATPKGGTPTPPATAGMTAICRARLRSSSALTTSTAGPFSSTRARMPSSMRCERTSTGSCGRSSITSRTGRPWICSERGRPEPRAHPCPEPRAARRSASIRPRFFRFRQRP